MISCGTNIMTRLFVSDVRKNVPRAREPHSHAQTHSQINMLLVSLLLLLIVFRCMIPSETPRGDDRAASDFVSRFSRVGELDGLWVLLKTRNFLKKKKGSAKRVTDERTVRA